MALAPYRGGGGGTLKFPQSHDLKELLELDHEGPVRLLELVTEVVLAGVDRLPTDL